MQSLFLTPRIAEGMKETIAANWQDASGVIDELRLVKSPHEMKYSCWRTFCEFPLNMMIGLTIRRCADVGLPVRDPTYGREDAITNLCKSFGVLTEDA